MEMLIDSLVTCNNVVHETQIVTQLIKEFPLRTLSFGAELQILPLNSLPLWNLKFHCCAHKNTQKMIGEPRFLGLRLKTALN
jgi:hypothetical protein